MKINLVLKEYLPIYLFVVYYAVHLVVTYYPEMHAENTFRVLFYIPFIVWGGILVKYKDDVSVLYKSNPIYLVITIFIIMVSVNIFYLIYPEPFMSISITRFQMSILFFSIVNFLLGIHLAQNIQSNLSKKIIIGTFIFMLIMLLINMQNNHLDTRGVSGLYLALGDNIVIIALMVAYVTCQRRVQTVLFLVVLYLTFVIQSRATFFSFLLVTLFYIWKNYSTRTVFFIITLLALVAGLAINNGLINIDTRMFGFFVSGTDASLSERTLQFKSGLEALKDNLFFGDYAGQVHEFINNEYSMGGYMHNFISYWRQYGIIVFFALFGLYFFMFFKSLSVWFHKHDMHNDAIFYISLFCMMEFLLFRSYKTTHMWLALGMMIQYHIPKKNVL